MMLRLETTGQFRKDYKRVKKRGYDMNLLENVIQSLLEERLLAAKYHDHPLTGNYTGFRECHVLPDWLLIYTIKARQTGFNCFLYWDTFRPVREVNLAD